MGVPSSPSEEEGEGESCNREKVERSHLGAAAAHLFEAPILDHEGE